MSYRSQRGQRSSDKPIVRVAFIAVIFSVIANMGLQYFRADDAQEEASAVTVQLRDLSGRTAACVDSGDARSLECLEAKGKAVAAANAPKPDQATTQTVTIPYPVTVTQPGTTSYVPLPIPSVSVVTGTVTQPGTTATVTGSKTTEKTVTKTSEAPPKTETVNPPPRTETRTETDTVTTGPPPLVVIGG